MYFENTLDTVCAGKRFRDRNDQVRKLYKFDQNLRHIIDERYNFTLRNISRIDPDRAGIDQGDCRRIDYNKSDRISQSRQFSNEQLPVCQFCISLLEFLRFLFFLMECPDHSDTGQIFSCFTEYLIESGLHFFIKRHRYHHDSENNHGQKRYRYNENKCRLHIDGKSHDHCAKDNKR